MADLKTNTSELQEILEILADKASGGGIDTTDATASASDILDSKTAYVNGEKITGTIPTKTSTDVSISDATVTIPSGYYASDVTKTVATTEQTTPSISIDANGKITASATQTAGFVGAGTKTATKQMTVQSAKTITPSTSRQTAVASGVYTTGAITVAGDSNLVASNIKSGVTIFGVTGTYDNYNDACIDFAPLIIQARQTPILIGGEYLFNMSTFSGEINGQTYDISSFIDYEITFPSNTCEFFIANLTNYSVVCECFVTVENEWDEDVYEDYSETITIGANNQASVSFIDDTGFDYSLWKNASVRYVRFL